METVSRRLARRMEATILVLVLTGVGVSAYRSMTKSLDRKQLEIHVADLRSFASEGKLLCDQIEAQTVTATFLATHAKLLGHKSQAVTRQLQSTRATPDVADRASRAAELSRELGSAFDELPQSSRAAAKASTVAATFERLARTLSAEEETLR